MENVFKNVVTDNICNVYSKYDTILSHVFTLHQAIARQTESIIPIGIENQQFKIRMKNFYNLDLSILNGIKIGHLDYRKHLYEIRKLIKFLN